MNPEREIDLKSHVSVKAKDIGGYFHDVAATSAVRFYQVWKRQGYPYGPWGDNPSILFQIVELLGPVDDMYHPRLI